MSGRDDSLAHLYAWSDLQALAEVDHFGVGIHENNLLPYFAKSPFSSNLSKNKILLDQNDPAIIQTREHFEAELRRREGLEYVVAYGPKDFGTGAEASPGLGQWVIRKQQRTRSQDAGDPWQIEVLDAYFVIGHTITQAPRLSDLLACRLLSAGSNIQKLLDDTTDLASYNPALRHHYISPKLKKTPAQSSVPVSGMAIPNPEAGRETTPMPSQQTAREGSVVSTSRSGPPADGASTGGGLDALAAALSNFSRYREEYMDENPFQGEPGSFHLSTTQQSVQARADAAKKALEAAQVKPDISRAATPMSKSEPIPAVQAPVLQKSADSVKPKIKRRKSKAPTSPSSPLARASSPESPRTAMDVSEG